MRSSPRMRGQPVVVLALVLGGWATLRSALWEAPFISEVMEKLEVTSPVEDSSPGTPMLVALKPRRSQLVSGPVGSAPMFLQTVSPAILAPVTSDRIAPYEYSPEPAAAQLAAPARPNPFALPAAPYQPIPPWAQAVTSRWSADSWVLLRRDTTTAITSGRGSYGNSQVGAVLRYRLFPASFYQPMAYLRVSKALAGVREGEAALGLSARPLPPVPLRAAAELRVTRVGERTLARPSAYVVTEIPAVALPLGFIGEAYGQAGYVGGQYASGFVDGQLRAERRLAQLGNLGVNVGVGLWGGAQKGASRLDAGPTASLTLPVGKIGSRVSVDWRVRVAGQANPASGPALTISAGF